MGLGPVFLALPAIAIGIFACQAQDAREAEAVRSADAAWAQATLSKNVERMLSFYDENAVFLGIPGKLVSGRQALRELRTDFFSRPGYELTWKCAKVEVAKSGDLAYSTGDWKQVYTQDGKERRSSGNYLAVWKKQGDGSWKVLLDKP
jgi:uncharacterized protein (TIGR02246 family)